MSELKTPDESIETNYVLNESSLYRDCKSLPEMMKEYQRICRKYFELDMQEGCYLYEMVELMNWKLSELIKGAVTTNTGLEVVDIEHLIDDVNHGAHESEEGK